jgi:hypothetical protein
VRRIGAKLQELRAEAGAGTPIGYVFALGIGAVAATLAYFATHEPGEPFPWLQVVIMFLAALSGPLLATWRRRHHPADPADPVEGP